MIVLQVERRAMAAPHRVQYSPVAVPCSLQAHERSECPELLWRHARVARLISCSRVRFVSTGILRSLEEQQANEPLHPGEAPEIWAVIIGRRVGMRGWLDRR